jgi:hypothetical protein
VNSEWSIVNEANFRKRLAFCSYCLSLRSVQTVQVCDATEAHGVSAAGTIKNSFEHLVGEKEVNKNKNSTTKNR